MHSCYINKKSRHLLVSLAVLSAASLALGGCSARDIYQSVQSSRLNECARLQHWRQKECSRLYDTPWHLYQLERQSLIAADGAP